MNFLFFLATLVSSTHLFSFSLKKTETVRQVPNNTDLQFAYKLLNESIAKICKSYPVYCVGTGTGGDCLKFSIDFEIQGPISRDEARDFVLCARNLTIENFNKSSHKNRYYSKHKFENKNFQITLFIKNKDGSKIFDPEIVVADCCHYEVEFLTNDPENEFKYKNTYKETLEEAEAKNQAYLKSLKNKPGGAR